MARPRGTIVRRMVPRAVPHCPEHYAPPPTMPRIAPHRSSAPQLRTTGTFSAPSPVPARRGRLNRSPTLSSELSSHSPSREVSARSAPSRSSTVHAPYPVFARPASRAVTASGLGARGQDDDVQRTGAHQVDVRRQLVPEEHVLDHRREPGLRVRVRRRSRQPVPQPELGLASPSAPGTWSSRPETIIRRKRSPRTCAARAASPAASGAWGYPHRRRLRDRRLTGRRHAGDQHHSAQHGSGPR